MFGSELALVRHSFWSQRDTRHDTDAGVNNHCEWARGVDAKNDSVRFVWFAEVNADKTIRRQSRLLPGYAEQTQMLGSLMSDVTVTRPWSVSGPVSQSEGGRGRVTQARIWFSARTGAQECSAHCERIGGEEILELEPQLGYIWKFIEKYW